MVSIKWFPYVDCSAACAVDWYLEISPLGNFVGSNPAPGLNRLPKIIPKPIAIVVIISKSTSNTYFNSGNNAVARNVIFVVQMNAYTPCGANFKIFLIIQNTASSDPLKISLTGSAFLPTAANPNPKNTA